MSFLFGIVFLGVALLSSHTSELKALEKAENVKRNCMELFKRDDCAKYFGLE
jgi:hypothetical protein